MGDFREHPVGERMCQAEFCYHLGVPLIQVGSSPLQSIERRLFNRNSGGTVDFIHPVFQGDFFIFKED